jgi:hypothetical protein
MAIDYTDIDQLVNDFQLMMDDTSYDKEAQIYQLRLLAMQGLRELTFDVEQSVKTTTLLVDSTTLQCTLPNDYLKLLKVGYKNDDGNFVSLGYDSNLSLDSSVSSGVGSSSYDENNPYYHTDIGKKFGVGGGKNSLGYYRLNRNDNTINFSSDLSGKTIFIEYISDGTNITENDRAADHIIKLTFNNYNELWIPYGSTGRVIFRIPHPTATGFIAHQDFSFVGGTANSSTPNNYIPISASDTASDIARKFADVINSGHPSGDVSPFSSIMSAISSGNTATVTYKNTKRDNPEGNLTDYGNLNFVVGATNQQGKALTKGIELIQMGSNLSAPRIHKFCEEALRCYIYYKYIQRKRGIPANEKQMAKRAYYNEKRLARARMMNFNKEAAMQVSRKAFKQSPKI